MRPPGGRPTQVGADAIPIAVVGRPAVVPRPRRTMTMYVTMAPRLRSVDLLGRLDYG